MQSVEHMYSGMHAFQKKSSPFFQECILKQRVLSDEHFQSHWDSVQSSIDVKL